MTPSRMFRRTKSVIGGRHPLARMTWASRSVSRSINQTRLFLRKRLWVWPIVAVLVLGIFGVWTSKLVESTMEANLRTGLQSFVTLQSAMVEKWLAVQQANARQLADAQPTRTTVYPLLKPPPDGSSPELGDAELHATLSRHLGPTMTAHRYPGYFIADRSQRIVASSYPTLVGQQDVPEFREFLSRCLDGHTTVSLPFASTVSLPDSTSHARPGQPVMYVAAPLRDEETFQVVGVLALQIRPGREFTEILQLGQIGETGETYAFDDQGRMISGSRFDDQLILIGVLADQPGSQSILQVMLRDPGGNMMQGHRPNDRRANLPLTKMAADALAGNSGVDVDGYRDYRGVPVVGAWKWLPDYRMGIATEVDVEQAFRPLFLLRRTYYALFGLLGLSSVAIFVFTIVLERSQREAQKAVVEAQQLGQYHLEEKLGEGAMGIVYKGHHAMLRRPAAIKMLNIDSVNEASLERFEREVRITCQLNHPNTVAIYDYGRTPEGVFYYAMEYIEGMDLQTLVTRYGPQPEARVIHILRQMCGSLFEAHSQGLVHRDIKPANTMLARRGCEPDVVKVLDFGLVKAADDRAAGQEAGGLTGTPLYMSPEAIQAPLSVDACSDLYAVGAVGYFLLTGYPVFEATGIVELCRMHVDEDPTPPSERANQPVTAQLEHALLSCLEKKRSLRPQTARDLARLLDQCPTAHDWSVVDGDAWWSRHARGSRRPDPAGQPSSPAKYEVDVERTIDQTS